MPAATAYRIIENNALLAAFEAVTDHAGYWPAFGAVEHAINTDEMNGRFDEADRVRAEWTRINRALRPMLDVTPLEILSLAETRRRDPELALRMADAFAQTDVNMPTIDALITSNGY